mgnify:FL=1
MRVEVWEKDLLKFSFLFNFGKLNQKLILKLCIKESKKEQLEAPPQLSINIIALKTNT